MGRLLALFVIVPLVDIYLLTVIHGYLGFLNTLLLVIATGLLGSWLVRLEGKRVWQAYALALREGRMPKEGFLGGALLLLGGALLVSPGVLTDVVGLLLLIPQSRRALAEWLRPHLMGRIQAGARRGTIRIVTVGPPFGASAASQRQAPPGAFEPDAIVRRIPAEPRPARRVIDADYEIADDASS